MNNETGHPAAAPSHADQHANLLLYLADGTAFTIDELARNLGWPRYRINDRLAELVARGRIVPARGREHGRTVVRYSLRTLTPETAP